MRSCEWSGGGHPAAATRPREGSVPQIGSDEFRNYSGKVCSSRGGSHLRKSGGVLDMQKSEAMPVEVAPQVVVVTLGQDTAGI